MGVAIGTVIGPYEVLAKLGEGGMGEVYRARDTRLRREVALKLLPPSLVSDPDRLVRFRREAQLLAALNHPNVAQVYGIEHADDSPPAIAMELVPGRTLDDLVREATSRQRSDGRSRGLPFEQVVSIGKQIAAALEAAHENGVIHRDLKPSNVKVRDDGVVKVLDFGLAKADESGGPSVASDSPLEIVTVTSPAITEAGLILGTAAYMSPEQARGRPVDKRADIWSYGAVLFELLTGERLFPASHTVTETIASVIKDDLQLDRLPSGTPRELRTLIARCLERDPAERLRDIGEARILLSRSLESGDTPAARSQPVTGRRARYFLLTATGLMLLALGAGAMWTMRPPAPKPSPRKLDLAVPERLREVEISNDGTRIAYRLGNQLYVRRLDELQPNALGSLHVTARELAWAPDDRAIAFMANATIQTIPASGGQPFVVTQVPGNLVGLAWLANDTIVFSVGFDTLYTAPASGGPATRLLTLEAEREIDFHEIAPLPGNRLIVNTHLRENDIDIVELVELTGERRRFTLTRDPDVGAFRYLGTPGDGWLLFVREGTNAGVWSVPFTENSIDFNQARLLVPGATSYSVARDGTVLATIAARERRALVWVDETGAETPAAGEPIEVPNPSLELSPDGRHAAFVQGASRTAGGYLSVNGVVVVRDLRTGVDTRLASAEQSSSWADVSGPTWSPDGQRIIHRTGRVGNPSLVERRADVAGTARTLTPGELGRLLPDRRTFLFTRDSGRLHRALVDAEGRLGAAEPLFPADAAPAVRDFDVSADGRLIAFDTAAQGGRVDVFVAEIAKPGERWLVQEGGSRPRFAPDGRHLYFTRGTADPQSRPEGQLVRRAITTSGRISFAPPEVLLTSRSGPFSLGSYDTAPDGRRVLMFRPAATSDDSGARLILVQQGIDIVSR